MKLTLKQEAFIDYYIETGNATESAIRAGYSKKTAHDIGCENLKKPKIRTHIEARKKELAQKREWSIDRLIDEFEEVKKRCMQQEPVIRFNKETGEHEETGEYVFKEQGVIKSLENIGKLLGFYTEKVESKNETEITVKLEGEVDEWSK